MEAARHVADRAYQALLKEVMLTPKPGLVDRRNSGAHRDMHLQLFLDSANAISPWFPHFVEIGAETAGSGSPRDRLDRFRSAGLLCEAAMFKATNGVNTHKGAIFSLGLLCSAAGYLMATGRGPTRSTMCAQVAESCAGLVTRELAGISLPRTAGERTFQQYGLTGARGEAESGYATVTATALPAYEALLSGGISEELALLQTLLELFVVNGDTNLVSRGGPSGLEYVRGYAAHLLSTGGVLAPAGPSRLAAFDDDLIARNLSPSGSADLLAVTWFLAQFPDGPAKGSAGSVAQPWRRSNKPATRPRPTLHLWAGGGLG